jgi:hypothetical protein
VQIVQFAAWYATSFALQREPVLNEFGAIGGTRVCLAPAERRNAPCIILPVSWEWGKRLVEIYRQSLPG